MLVSSSNSINSCPYGLCSLNNSTLKPSKAQLTLLLVNIDASIVSCDATSAVDCLEAPVGSTGLGGASKQASAQPLSSCSSSTPPPQSHSRRESENHPIFEPYRQIPHRLPKSRSRGLVLAEVHFLQDPRKQTTMKLKTI